MCDEPCKCGAAYFSPHRAKACGLRKASKSLGLGKQKTIQAPPPVVAELIPNQAELWREKAGESTADCATAVVAEAQYANTKNASMFVPAENITVAAPAVSVECSRGDCNLEDASVDLATAPEVLELIGAQLYEDSFYEASRDGSVDLQSTSIECVRAEAEESQERGAKLQQPDQRDDDGNGPCKCAASNLPGGGHREKMCAMRKVCYTLIIHIDSKFLKLCLVWQGRGCSWFIGSHGGSHSRCVPRCHQELDEGERGKRYRSDP